MKSESATFALKRLKRFGQHPIMLCRIISPNFATLFLSTVSITVGGNVYLPYLLSYNEISFELSGSEAVGVVGGVDLFLGRNASTDTLLTAISQGAKVELDLGFNDPAGLQSADLVAMARMIVSHIADISQSTFSVRCLIDEKKFVDLPLKLITDDGIAPKDNVGQPVPIVGGKIADPLTGHPVLDTPTPYVLTDTDKFYAARSMDCSPTTLRDQTSNYWIATQFRSLSSISITHALEYVPEQELYVFDNNASGQNTFGTILVGDEWNVNPSTTRTLYRLCDTSAPTNTAVDWLNAINDNRTDWSRLTIGGNTILALGFFKRNAPADTNPTTEFVVYEVIQATTSAPAAQLNLEFASLSAVPIVWTTLNTKTFSGADTFPFVFSISLSATPIWNQGDIILRLRLSVASGTGQTADIRLLGLRIAYTDSGLFTKKTVLTGSDFSVPDSDVTSDTDYPAGWPHKCRHIRGRVVRCPGFRGIKIGSRVSLAAATKPLYAEMFGPYLIGTAGGGFLGGLTLQEGFKHPLFFMQMILFDYLGFGAADVDSASFNDAVNYLRPTASGGDFPNRWEFGAHIGQRVSGIQLINQICQQCGILFFRSANGTLKLAVKNKKLASQAVRVFSDKAEDYIISGLVIEKEENVFTKFSIFYKFDFARQKWAGKLLKDRTNDTVLATAYANNGNIESEFPAFEATFIRTPETAANIYQILRNFYAKAHIVASFESGLDAATVELGDIIQIDHNAAWWAASSKNFQVTKADYRNGRIFLTALEVTG